MTTKIEKDRERKRRWKQTPQGKAARREQEQRRRDKQKELIRAGQQRVEIGEAPVIPVMTSTISSSTNVPAQPTLFSAGVLCSLDVSYWRGRKALQAQDLGMDESAVPEIFSLGRKLLVPKETIKVFEKIEMRAYYLLERLSFSFPIGRSRFVTYAALPGLAAELESLKERFEAERRSFLSRYEEYRAEMLERYKTYREALERGYVSTSSLASRFTFSWVLYEVGLPKDSDGCALGQEMSDDARAARKDASEKAAAQYREQMDTFVTQAVATLRERVVTIVETARKNIQSGSPVAGRSLMGIKQAISQFRALNFVGDGQVEKALQDLEVVLPAGGDAVKPNTDLAGVLGGAIDGVLKTIQDSQVSDVAREYKRRIAI